MRKTSLKKKKQLHGWFIIKEIKYRDDDKSNPEYKENKAVSRSAQVDLSPPDHPRV